MSDQKMTVISTNTDEPVKTFEVKYTQEQIIEMRRKGLPKPDDCSWIEWRSPMARTQKGSAIAYMAACGTNHEEIAEAFEMELPEVKRLLRNPFVAAQVDKLQYELFGKNAEQRFTQLIPKAIKHIEMTMENESMADGTRLDAAKTVLDRALGKPKQQIEVGGSLVRELIEKLNKSDVTTIDTSSSEVVTEAEIVENKEEKDEIDKWMEEN